MIKHCEYFNPGDRILFEGTEGTVIDQYHQWVTILFDGALNPTNWDCVYCDIAKI